MMLNNKVRATSRFILSAAFVAALPLSAKAALVFSTTFDSAAGTANGAAIAGTTGGTATIRDSAGAESGAAVASTEPGLGDSGYLQVTSIGAEGTSLQLGARFTPTSAANSLGAMFSNTGGINALNGGIDFFMRTDTAVTPSSGGDALRFIDAAAPTGGLRLTLTSAGANTYRVEVIRQTGGNNVLATNTLSFKADTVYHLGVGFSTDGEGLTTARLYGIEGTGAINTNAADVAGGLLGSMTFNLDETAVTTGFTTGPYDFGKLRANTNADFVQDFDTYRLYDSLPTVFPAQVPEPAAGAALIGMGGLLLSRRRKLTR